MFSRAIISDINNLVYFPIDKSGQSTVQSILDEYTRFHGGTVSKTDNYGVLRLKYPPEEWKWFSVIRMPSFRFCSAFAWCIIDAIILKDDSWINSVHENRKIKKFAPHLEHIHENMSEEDLDVDVVTELMAYILEDVIETNNGRWDTYVDPHFTPQNVFLPKEVETFVWLSQLNVDLPVLLKNKNNNIKELKKLCSVQNNKNRTPISTRYLMEKCVYENYSICELIEEAYRSDLDLFFSYEAINRVKNDLFGA